MDNFIDTNMAIAYTFSSDKWHDKSVKFISNSKNTYWSNNVKNEFDKKFEEIFNEIDEYLSEVHNLLKNNSKTFINQYSFEKYILNQTKDCKLDYYKKNIILSFFWENNNIIYNDSPSSIQFKFASFLINYLEKPDSLKDKLEKILKLYNCDVNNYKKYNKLLSILIYKLAVHNPDYKIVLDAHDFGLKTPVRFITSDKKLYEKIIKTNKLEIVEIKLCN